MTQLQVGEDDLVTGEAVALDLPPATVGIRAVSGMIDLLVAGLLLLLVVLVSLTAAAGADDALLAAAQLTATVLVLVGLPVATETIWHGKTVGKWVMGLRTVRDDAGPVSLRHALVRSLVAVVEVWMLSGAPALLSALVSRKSKRVGDHVAGTYVVRDRYRLTMPAPPTMPYQLTRWAATADVAALPVGLALAVRQFLARAAALTPQARWETGTRLAREVSRYAAPAPPPGTHPEAFLAAVLSERRNRDLDRLQRTQALRARLDESVRRSE